MGGALSMPNLPANGGCRCGALRVRMTKPPIMTSACHCTGCQRMTGSAFSLSVTVPEDGFEVVSGNAVLGGLRAEDAQHQHCPDCKSWVFTTAPALAGFVNLRATMLDETGWFAPFIENFTSESLPWANLGAPHRYEAFPDMEDYGPLAAEFAGVLASKES